MSDRRPSGLVLEQPARPAVGRAELAAAAASGLRVLRIADTVELGPGDCEATLGFLRLLVDAAGVGLRVGWRGTVSGLDVDLLRHLDPPRGSDGGALWPIPATVRLLVRRGPGFVQIHDDRGQGPARGYVLDDPALVDCLNRFSLPGPAADQREAAALETLAGLGLVVGLGDMALSLPIRFTPGRG